MVDIKKLRTPAEIAIIVTLVVSLGVNFIPNDEGYLPYGCDKDTVPDMMCYKLSRVNDDGIQRNCYYDRGRPAKYKVCSTGWFRLEEVIEPQELTCPEEKTCEVCETNLEPNECEVCEEPKECKPEVKYVGNGCPETKCGTCSGGGSCSCPPSKSCSNVCPLSLYDGCELIIAYTDNEKWFCDGVGQDAKCVSDELVEEDFCNIK